MRTNPGAFHLSRLAPALLIVVSGIVVAACSGSGATSSAAIQSGTPVAAASATPAASQASSGGGRGDYDYGTGTEPSPASEAPGASAVGVNTATGPLGTWLTGVGGLTLYTFEPDTDNTSTCVDDCAQAWPPFTIGTDDILEAGDGVTGALTTLERPDGSRQVAYDGAPLYYFANDRGPGDTNGQGLGDVWFVAEP